MPYTRELGDAICEGIAQGLSLREICRAENMPPASTVCTWLASHQAFAEQYARAREAQADALAEETLEIADDAKNDWMERNDPDNPGWVANGESVQRSRLRVDARKWFTSKVAPKKYGDKVTQEISGPNGGPIQTEDVSARELLARRISGVASRAGAGGTSPEPK